MGQYFYPIVLDESNKVKSWFLAHDYDTCYEISGIKHNSKVGIKIFEHSYFNNPFLLAVQSLMNNPTRIIWLSDAHPDYQQYKLEKENKVIPQPLSKDWPFLVNLSKKEYIITKKLTQLHPLPLLTCRTLANNNNFNGLRAIQE